MNQFRHLFRRLSRAPMFTVVTIMTLAIGIGANTAIFSVLRGVLLKPLPYPNPERLVGVWHTAALENLPTVNASPSTYFTYREEGRVFEDQGVWRGDSVSITGVAEPEQVPCLFVTDGVLPMLGVQPALGRWFTKKDDSPDSPDTVMLMHGYWQSRFGGDRNVLGRRILIDGRPKEIIGVMPSSFVFMNRSAKLIMPLRFNRGEVFIGNFSYQGIARLKPGVTIEQANADVARMLPLMLEKFRPAPGMSLKMFQQIKFGPKIRPLMEDVVGDIGKVLWVLMGTVTLVLFIACANVANLLLVRADGRQHELAIRAALGAGWSQIAKELLLESATLGLIGGIAGLGVAYAGLRGLVALKPGNLPRLEEIVIDGPVLLFTLTISIAAGILFGLIPVFKYAGPRIGLALRQSGRSLSDSRERHRARNVLVVVQVALALVLLTGSGLMIRTVLALNRVQPGFTNPDQIMTLRVSIPRAQVKEPVRVARMHNDILDKIAAIPGVERAALITSITMDENTSNDPIFAEDKPLAEGKIPPLRRYKSIGPGVFKTMGQPLLAGRDIEWTDIYEMRPVMMISENMAREIWGSASAAIGRRVRESPKSPWREVIGVVANERDNGMDRPAPTIAYWPMMIKNFWGEETVARRTMAYAIRSSRAGSASLMEEVRRAVWAVNPDLPLADVRTVREIQDRSMARTSFTLVMLSLAAGMALILGLVGIYGVISYSVAQRTREIGIRLALGAREQEVRRMFLGHGLMLSGIGVACGAAAALAATRLMKSLLFEISPTDPVTYGAVSTVLVGAALLASYLPARRATRIAPLEALRME